MRLVEMFKFVNGLTMTVPSTSTPQYVSFKDWRHCTIVIKCKNATTVTGSAITLKQATAIAGTAEKALAFTKMWANTDLGAAPDTLTETAVASNTFTANATNNKNLKYVIEVDAAELDGSNGFDCLRVGTGDATAQTVDVEYIMSQPRYASASPPTAVAD